MSVEPELLGGRASGLRVVVVPGGGRVVRVVRDEGPEGEEGLVAVGPGDGEGVVARGLEGDRG